MNTSKPSRYQAILGIAALACLLSAPVRALIVNGGFESGFTGWTVANQPGSEGTFSLQSGTLSPVLGLSVPAPPGGLVAAMTDAAGPGSHVLYQDFLVPAGVSTTTLAFSLFINNTATAFYAPATLDFGTPTLNQQARVDLMPAAANPFSVAPGDILQNLFQTNPGDPLVSGYTAYQFDVTGLLQAQQGNTLRLRFAQVDNVQIFNLGVDNVAFGTSSVSVPDSLPWFMSWISLVVVVVAAAVRRRRTIISCSIE
jgi:hypothetical protein